MHAELYNMFRFIWIYTPLKRHCTISPAKQQRSGWRKSIPAAARSRLACRDPGADASAQPERHSGSQWSPQQQHPRLSGVCPAHPRLHSDWHHPPHPQDGETLPGPALQHRQEQLNRYSMTKCYCVKRQPIFLFWDFFFPHATGKHIFMVSE